MTINGPHWEHFSHQADIGVRGIATSLAGAFEQAALAMMAVITEPDQVDGSEVVDIECQALDMEYLLADWLNAVIYEMAVRKMLFNRFEVDLAGTHLRARAWGEAVVVAKHHPAVEIKGATYTELKVYQRDDGGWIAQCVVDV